MLTVKELKKRLAKYDDDTFIEFVKEGPKSGQSFLVYTGERVTMGTRDKIILCFR